MEEWSTPIDDVELERHLMMPGVKRIPVRNGRVRGMLYLPPGDGPFPGVIDMFGGVGGCAQHRSGNLLFINYINIFCQCYIVSSDKI